MSRRWNSPRTPRTMIAVLAISVALFTSPALSTQVPNPLASNEVAAVATLRQIAAAQSEFKQALDIDTNCDAVGEYGYFAELAGTVPMRVADLPSGNCTPTCGVWGQDELVPPLLRNELGSVIASSVVHQGYVFQLWLPGAKVFGKVNGIEEDWIGGKQAPPYPDSVNGARFWCCYAWPLAFGQTGRSAFFVNQRGQVLRYPNRSVTPFSGMANMPNFDEAFAVAGDMSSSIRVGIPGGAAGSRWMLVP
jgi:hypothetical protein